MSRTTGQGKMSQWKFRELRIENTEKHKRPLRHGENSYCVSWSQEL